MQQEEAKAANSSDPPKADELAAEEVSADAWLTVYTDYGYGVVNAKKFNE